MTSEKIDKQSLMVRIPLPGGRVARVPLSILESYAAAGVALTHSPNPEDVTAHHMAVDTSAGTNHWHSDAEWGHCEFADENGTHQTGYVLHFHPFGTEYAEVVST
jgi:hypothetical protein